MNEKKYVPIEAFDNCLICDVFTKDILTKKEIYLGKEAFHINDCNLMKVEQVEKYEKLIKNIKSRFNDKLDQKVRKVLIELLEECDELLPKNRKRFSRRGSKTNN